MTVEKRKELKKLRGFILLVLGFGVFLVIFAFSGIGPADFKFENPLIMSTMFFCYSPFQVLEYYQRCGQMPWQKLQIIGKD